MISHDARHLVIAICSGLAFGYAVFGINICMAPFWKCKFVDGSSYSILLNSVMLGATGGAMVSSMLVSWIGHTKLLVIGSILLLSSFGSFAINLFGVQLVSRICVGISIGVISSIVPGYLCEIGLKKWRMFIRGLQQISICVSILLGYSYSLFINHWFSTCNEEDGFKRALFSTIPCVVIALAMFLASYKLPDSMLWVWQRQRVSQTIYNQPQENITESQVLLISTNLQNSAPALGGVYLFQGFLLTASHQLTGVNAIIVYISQTNSILNDSGYVVSLLAWNVICSLVALLVVGRFPRRYVMIPTCVILTLSMLALSVERRASSGSNSHTQKWIFMLLVGLFLTAFEVGPGTLFWINGPELFPGHTLSAGFSVLNSLQWLFALIIVSVFPNTSHWVGFLICACLGVVLTTLMFLKFPETSSSNPSDQLLLRPAQPAVEDNREVGFRPYSMYSERTKRTAWGDSNNHQYSKTLNVGKATKIVPVQRPEVVSTTPVASTPSPQNRTVHTL